MGIKPLRAGLLWVLWIFIICGTPGCDSISSSDLPLPTRLVIPATATPQKILPTLTPIATATPTPMPAVIEYHRPTPQTGEGMVGLNGLPEGVNPLTGLKVADPTLLDRRPILMKVSNFPRYGRPHAGLSSADIVFEYYIGEATNRFLALFYGKNADKIGPVRSGRLVDAWLTNLYGGILAYGNADPKVDTVLLNQLEDRAISFNRSACPAMCGQDTHDVAGVFGNSGEMSRFIVTLGVDNQRPNLSGMLFDSAPPSGGVEGSFVGVQYNLLNRGEWRFDEESSLYLRWIESDDGSAKGIPMIPLVDRNTDKQLGFSNVIILFTHYTEYAPTLHDIQMWDNLSGKRAILFRNGQKFEGIWKTPGHFQPIQFYNKYGMPFALRPGNTWMVIAGESSTFTETEPGRWEMLFQQP